MSKRLTALVPAHNDAYTLWLALRSYADVFDEIVVYDDCSDDETAEVVLDAGHRHPNIRLVADPHRTVDRWDQLGWIAARNRLLAATDSDWLFWLDADDVLIESQAHLLRRIAESGHAAVRLQLAEMWGDRDHTTQRLKHYDACHLFVNRARLPGFHWTGLRMARPVLGLRPGVSQGPLFWHCKGLKPDARLAARIFMRRWLASKRGGTLSDYMGERTDEEIHALAMKLILRAKGDRIRPYAGRPPRPMAVVTAPRRFQIVYDGATPVERRDLGWRL